MKTLKACLAITAIVLLGACVPSINPFYLEKDVIMDKQIEGEWINEENETWKFEADKDNTAYTLKITQNDGKTGELKAKLFKLGKECFIDLLPNNCEFATNQADIINASVFPGHLLMRVSQFGPQLKIATMDYDWLSKTLEKTPSALPNHVEEKRIILTASTKQLQKFTLKHLDKLFPKEEAFNRKGSSQK